MANTWVEHVKKYKTDHCVSYKEALKLAGPSYKKCKKPVMVEDKPEVVVVVEEDVKPDKQVVKAIAKAAKPVKPKPIKKQKGKGLRRAGTCKKC